MGVPIKPVAQTLAVAGVAALLGLLVWKVATDERSEVSVAAIRKGESVNAPDFTLERLDREGELSLASLRGKVVVINFWASWCGPCRAEAPILERAWRDHRRRGLVVVGVDFNDFDGDARKFAKDVGWSYPIVRDRSGQVLSRYGGSGVPETYVVDRRGRLVGEPFRGSIETDREAFAARVQRALRA